MWGRKRLPLSAHIKASQQGIFICRILSLYTIKQNEIIYLQKEMRHTQRMARWYSGLLPPLQTRDSVKDGHKSVHKPKFMMKIAWSMWPHVQQTLHMVFGGSSSSCWCMLAVSIADTPVQINYDHQSNMRRMDCKSPGNTNGCLPKLDRNC